MEDTKQIVKHFFHRLDMKNQAARCIQKYWRSKQLYKYNRIFDKSLENFDHTISDFFQTYFDPENIQEASCALHKRIDLLVQHEIQINQQVVKPYVRRKPRIPKDTNYIPKTQDIYGGISDQDMLQAYETYELKTNLQRRKEFLKTSYQECFTKDTVDIVSSLIELHNHNIHFHLEESIHHMLKTRGIPLCEHNIKKIISDYHQSIIWIQQLDEIILD